MPHGLPPPLDFARSDQVTDLEWLLLEIDRIEGCAETKRKVSLLFQAQAGKRIYFSHRALTKPAQVAAARQLMHQGNPTPVVRDRLVAAFGCSVRHAYTLIQQALAERGQERHAAMQAAQTDLFRAKA